MALRVRTLTVEEEAELRRRVASRTLPARAVEQARMIWAVHAGEGVPAVARRLGVGADVVRSWVRRFNAGGLAGLADRPRAGRPATDTPEEVGTVIAAALPNPQALGLPFGAWTLDRLAAYLHEQQGIAIKRSRIGEVLVDEGLRWRQQETWFGERAAPGRPPGAEVAAPTPVDPDFAPKGRRSSRSTPRRRAAA